jgi:hypothetical protein
MHPAYKTVTQQQNNSLFFSFFQLISKNKNEPSSIKYIPKTFGNLTAKAIYGPRMKTRERISDSVEREVREYSSPRYTM